jgi:hypothetical protein
VRPSGQLVWLARPPHGTSGGTAPIGVSRSLGNFPNEQWHCLHETARGITFSGGGSQGEGRDEANLRPLVPLRLSPGSCPTWMRRGHPQAGTDGRACAAPRRSRPRTLRPPWCGDSRLRGQIPASIRPMTVASTTQARFSAIAPNTTQPVTWNTCSGTTSSRRSCSFPGDGCSPPVSPD